MSELTVSPSEPYSHNPGGSPDNVSGQRVMLDGYEYLIDTLSGEYRRVDLPVVQQRNTADSRDLLLLPQDVWRIQMHSWHEGSGQTFFDRANTGDRNVALEHRFDASYGIMPWNSYEMSLLPETTRLGTVGASATFLHTHAGYVVACEGTVLRWWAALSEDATPTEQSIGSSPILSTAYDGDSVITLQEDGAVRKQSSPTVSALHGTFASATFIADVKDYLIAGVANVLKDITSGSATTIYTAPMTGFRWVGAAEGDRAIYVLGGANDRWVVHKVGIKDDASGLLPAVVAAQLPDGEIGYSIGSYLGYIFIGTNLGVRMAQATDSGDLTLGALIPTTVPVECFEGQDRFVWYGQSVDGTYASAGTENLDFPVGEVCGLGRMDLTIFTVTALTPAYATDLVVPSQSGKRIRSIVTFNDKRVFAIQGGGIWFESDTLMEAGWLSIGIITFTVDDTKTALNQQANWEPLAGELIFDISYDSTGYTRISEWALEGSVKSGSDTLRGQQFTRAAPRFTLIRDTVDTESGPVLSRWELRASPVQGGSSRWTIPIIVEESITVSGRAKVQDALTTKNRLVALYREGELVQFIEDATSYDVQVKGMDWRPQKLNRRKTAWQGVFVVTLQEVK